MTSSFVYQLTKYPLRSVKTALMGFIFIGLGMFIAEPGPALLDLQLLAGTTIEKTALLLPARSLGYAVGSVIGGVVGDRIDHQYVIITAMIVAIISMVLFPLFHSINLMYSFFFVGGIANGCIDTVVSSTKSDWLKHFFMN